MKIYIICPYNQSGGPRSLHQLGNKLIDAGFNVFMYYGYRSENTLTNTPLYSDCKAKIAKDIEDRKENILIVPESDTGWLNKYSKIKKVIWWLSLYFYLENDTWWISKFRTVFLGQPKIMSYLRYAHTKLSSSNFAYVHPKELKKIDYHLYNCEYVRDYLLDHNILVDKMGYLCGPIDIKKIDKKNVMMNKENFILYNPAKASPYILNKVLRYMKEKYPYYELQPLHGISHENVLEYLKKAKVYLDLGYFPGPERMPREACMNYCNIITSTTGAAANNNDVPIPQNFKFDLKKKNVSKICELMVDMCDNYNEYVHYYNEYRNKTISQINNFDRDVNNFIKIIRSISVEK